MTGQSTAIPQLARRGWMSTQKHPYWPTWSIVFSLWPAETCWWPLKCDNYLSWRLLTCFMCVDNGICNMLIGSDLCSTCIDREKQCGVQQFNGSFSTASMCQCGYSPRTRTHVRPEAVSLCHHAPHPMCVCESAHIHSVNHTHWRSVAVSRCMELCAPILKASWIIVKRKWRKLLPPLWWIWLATDALHTWATQGVFCFQFSRNKHSRPQCTIPTQGRVAWPVSWPRRSKSASLSESDSSSICPKASLTRALIPLRRKSKSKLPLVTPTKLFLWFFQRFKSARFYLSRLVTWQ